MHDEPEAQQSQRRTQDEAVAHVLSRLREIFAEREATNPTPESPRDPWVDKPGPLIAAEKEVWRCELIEKLTLAWCARPGGCALDRCKRSRRCAELESLQPMFEQVRAALAAAQARWPRPTELPQPPASGRPRRGGDRQ
jgi:hypothetical protein